MSQFLLHSTTHQSKSCTTIHCKKVYVYALTTTDCPCCSTSTLYPFPSPRNCSAVSRPHCTRTDTASDPRRARYTDTVTFLTASVGAGRRKRITWESNVINCSRHHCQEPPTPPATALEQAVHTASTSLAKLTKVSAEALGCLLYINNPQNFQLFCCASSQVHSFLCKEETKTCYVYENATDTQYACQFMTQQNQRPWTHIQIMHLYVCTYVQ